MPLSQPMSHKPVLLSFHSITEYTFELWCESSGPSCPSYLFMSDKSKCDRVFRAKTSTILTLDRMDFCLENYTHFRTSWQRLRSQNLSRVYSTPSEYSAILSYFSAILCEPCSQKSRFLLLRRKIPSYTRGLLGYFLGFLPSWPKPCGGNKGGNAQIF